MNSALVDAIDGLLPQTQCRLCSYSGCRPYAEAVAAGTAPVNQCPPGGPELIAELAMLLGIDPMPLNTAHGTPTPPAAAVIDEAACIGCALCIDACPVNAIVGARTLMHTVITAECTGCGLCLPPCPVDCITLITTGVPRNREVQRSAANRLKERYEAHRLRGAAQSRKKRATEATTTLDAAARKRATIDRVLARARARLAEKNG